MLVDGNLPEEQTRRLARNIYRASRGIQDMLQQLLNVSRGKSDACEMCSLREVIEAAWATVAPAADAREIELEMGVPDHLECPMERARIERVFSNLFENAIDAMRYGGKVVIRSEADHERVLVRVDDNGPGISPAVRALFRNVLAFAADHQRDLAFIVELFGDLRTDQLLSAADHRIGRPVKHARIFRRFGEVVVAFAVLIIDADAENFLRRRKRWQKLDFGKRHVRPHAGNSGQGSAPASTRRWTSSARRAPRSVTSRCPR